MFIYSGLCFYGLLLKSISSHSRFISNSRIYLVSPLHENTGFVMDFMSKLNFFPDHLRTNSLRSYQKPTIAFPYYSCKKGVSTGGGWWRRKEGKLIVKKRKTKITQIRTFLGYKLSVSYITANLNCICLAHISCLLKQIKYRFAVIYGPPCTKKISKCTRHSPKSSWKPRLECVGRWMSGGLSEGSWTGSQASGGQQSSEETTTNGTKA